MIDDEILALAEQAERRPTFRNLGANRPRFPLRRDEAPDFHELEPEEELRYE